MQVIQPLILFSLLHFLASCFPTPNETTLSSSSSQIASLMNQPYTTEIGQYEVIFDYFDTRESAAADAALFLQATRDDVEDMRRERHAQAADPVPGGQYGRVDVELCLHLGLVQLNPAKFLSYEHVFAAMTGASRMVRDRKRENRVNGSWFEVNSEGGALDTPIYGSFKRINPNPMTSKRY